MTATEAAELLGVHINTISKYLKEKKLRYKRISIRKVDIDPDSVFEIMPPERKVELQERIKIDLNKAKYREYMKKYVKEYDKQEWRKENKNRNKTETVITLSPFMTASVISNSYGGEAITPAPSPLTCTSAILPFQSVSLTT